MNCDLVVISSGTALRNRLACSIKLSSSIFVICVLCASAQRFPPRPVFSSGGTPQYTAVADVNGDGDQDIFVSNLSSNNTGVLSVLLGNGNGTFQPPQIIAGLPDAYPIVTADFNNDGKPDLAALDGAGGRVLIYLNNGSGLFSAVKISPADPQACCSLATGDINGDGKPDLVMTTGAGAFSLLPGQGNGLFGAAVLIAPGAAPLNFITVGDVNHDGHLDVAGASVATFGKDGAKVYLGKGGGMFVPGGGCGAADSNGQVVLADFQGNGNLDVAIALYGTSPPSLAPGYVLVCPGNGDGTFGAGVRYNAGYTPEWLASADMNGDGKPDLIIGDTFSNSVSVFLNHGNGALITPAYKYATASGIGSGLNVGDFHNSGKLDVIATTAGGVNLLANLGGGVLHAPLSVVPSLPLSSQPAGDNLGNILAVDFDKDGHLDLAAGALNFSQGSTPAVSVPLLFNSGDAVFVSGSDTIGNFPGSTPPIVNGNFAAPPIAIGDFNGDGKPDLAAYLSSTDTGLKYISIAYNAGTHIFSAGPNLNIPNQPAYFVAGDFNRDGYADLAVLDGNDVDVYLNQKNGSYSGPVSYHFGANPTFMAQRDINGDGKRDLIVTNHDSGDVSILLGKGDGTFAAPATYPASAHPNAVTIGDFNRDGKLDLAVGGDSVAILLGRGDGTFNSLRDVSTPRPIAFLIQADLRGTGIEDLLYVEANRSFLHNLVYVLYGKGDGSFMVPTGYSTQLFPSWLAAGDFNNDGTTDVAVSANSAITLLLNQGGTYISLTSSATTISAGQPVTFTATLTASVPGAGQPTGTIAFKNGPTGIGFVRVVNGRATFTTSGLSKGTHVLTASYWGNGFFNPHVSKPVSVTVQ
jgi:hypothetical protein